MTVRSAIAVTSFALAAGVIWFLFRPERALLDRRVSESAPAIAEVLLAGEFESRSHDGRGLAEIVRTADGTRVLRLTRFETLDGPDLQIYLLGSPRASSDADLESGGFASLGALKGNIGDQNYVIPAGMDLDRYGAVSVWCRRFGVNFTTATLTRPTPAGT